MVYMCVYVCISLYVYVCSACIYICILYICIYLCACVWTHSMCGCTLYTVHVCYACEGSRLMSGIIFHSPPTLFTGVGSVNQTQTLPIWPVLLASSRDPSSTFWGWNGANTPTLPLHKIQTLPPHLCSSLFKHWVIAQLHKLTLYWTSFLGTFLKLTLFFFHLFYILTAISSPFSPPPPLPLLTSTLLLSSPYGEGLPLTRAWQVCCLCHLHL